MTSFKLDIGQKNAQISKSDFDKPKNWETFRYRSNVKFSKLFVNKFYSNFVTLIYNKHNFSWGIYHENNERG